MGVSTHLKRFAREMHYPMRPEIWVRKRAIRPAPILYLPQRRIGFVKEEVNFSARLANAASFWHRSPVLDPNRRKPMLEVFSSGSKAFRVNSALFAMWFLFPLFLILSSDWIGLLVIFQALTAAVRLRTMPAAKTLAAFSSMDAASASCEREYGAR